MEREREVQETVYSVFGINPILEALDEQVVRPLTHHRYKNGPQDTPAPPKIVFFGGSQGCGHRTVCSVIVNELRRGRSNKRADIHYSNRDVKYLEWMQGGNTAADLSRIFSQAKEREFTVLAIHNFDYLCPVNIERARDEAEAVEMKRALLQQLDASPAGKILLVATSTREHNCDEEMLQKMDYKYHLPLPDAEAREEIILGMLEIEGAELAPPSLIEQLVKATRHDFSTSALIYTVSRALGSARARQQERRENGSRSEVLKVISADWTQYLDIGIERRVRYDFVAGEDDGDGDEEEEEDELFPEPRHRMDVPVPRAGRGDNGEDDLQILAEFAVDGQGQAEVEGGEEEGMEEGEEDEEQEGGEGELWR